MEYEFKFWTTTGAGDETVQCVLTYEKDEVGTYAENLKSITYQGVSVFSLLSEDQFEVIEMRGTMMLQGHLTEESDHAKTVDYDMRNI